MKTALMVLCAAMLLASGARLAILGRKGVQEYRLSRKENALVPHVGSFNAVIAEGDDINPGLEARDHLLVFTIHRERIGGDVGFWNRVVALANQASPHVAGRARYWGVCDSGAECNRYQSEAYFTIVGFLEPFEMRAVAEADRKREALLYDQRGALKVRIPRAASAAAEANLILQDTK